MTSSLQPTPQSNDGPQVRACGRVFALGLIALGGLVAAPGCASKPVVTADGIQDTARRTYYEGMQELASGNYIAATQLFQEVTRSPQYVRYTALARLRIGDALFLQDRYQEATEIYRSFANQFKSDPNLPYARFRVAACFYHRMPTEWFASPPAHELDQSVTHQAEAELKGFLSTFPTSRFAPEAREMLAATRRMLFDTELFAADFYAGRGSWRAVAWRLDRAVDLYPEFALDDELVWRMADAYRRAGDDAQAAKSYGLYLKSFPRGERKDEAKERLEAIRKGLDDTGRT